MGYAYIVAAALLYTAPAWVALAAALWLGERLTARKSLAVAMTLAGIALVASGSGAAASDGGGLETTQVSAMAWGLLAGLACAAYYLFGKRYFTRYDASTLFAYSLGLARLEATRAATVATLEPVAAAALAYAVWGEALRARGYVGAALVLAGVLLVATEREARVALDPPHEGPAPVS